MGRVSFKYAGQEEPRLMVEKAELRPMKAKLNMHLQSVKVLEPWLGMSESRQSAGATNGRIRVLESQIRCECADVLDLFHAENVNLCPLPSWNVL